MNDKQLDMVLGYLNEGTEIDEISWLMESINSLINESFELGYLFEGDIVDFPGKNNNKNDDEETKNVNKIGVKTRIKELIRRFINWIKKVITNLKSTIAKFAGKFNKKYFNKCLDSMIEQAEQLDKSEKEYKTALASNKTVASLMRLLNISKNGRQSQQFTDFISIFDQMSKVDFQDNEKVKNLGNRIVQMYESFQKSVENDFSDKSGFDSDAYLQLLKKIKESKGIELIMDFPDQLVKSYNTAYSQVAKIKDGDPKLINDFLSTMTKCCNIGLKLFSYVIKDVGSILSYASKKKIINAGNTSGIVIDRKTDKEINDEIKKIKRK